MWIHKRPSEFHARLEGRVSIRIDSILLDNSSMDKVATILSDVNNFLREKLESEFSELYVDNTPFASETENLGMVVVHGTNFRHPKLKCFKS